MATFMESKKKSEETTTTLSKTPSSDPLLIHHPFMSSLSLLDSKENVLRPNHRHHPHHHPGHHHHSELVMSSNGSSLEDLYFPATKSFFESGCGDLNEDQSNPSSPDPDKLNGDSLEIPSASSVTEAVTSIKMSESSTSLRSLSRPTTLSSRCPETSHWNDHHLVINKLKSDGFIRSDRVFNAMLDVNFANFGWSYSYSDASFIASELENCANLIQEGSSVLVINSWYYLYIPLCLALMVGPKGFVVGHGDEGLDFVRKDHAHILDSHRLILVNTDWDVYKMKGFSLKAPYDVILIHDKYFTDQIKDQLGPKGIAFDQVNNKIIYEQQV